MTSDNNHCKTDLMALYGSSFGNPGRLGYGWLFRDHNGNWISGFSGGCGYTNNMNVELQAIAHGLNIAQENGYQNLICETDSLTALKFINEGVCTTNPQAPIIDHIRSFKERGWQLNFQHSLREGNSCADWLAKQCSSMEHGVPLWHNCPSTISTFLLADAVGIARLRP